MFLLWMILGVVVYKALSRAYYYVVGLHVLRELWKEKDDMFFLCGFAE